MESQPNNGMFGDLNKKAFAATELERADMSDQTKVAAIVTINHAGSLQYLFGPQTMYDTTKDPPVIKAVFGSAQNSTSAVAPISLTAKVHGFTATIECKGSLPPGTIMVRRLEKEFLAGSP